MENVTISNNSASSYGGGIYCNDSYLFFSTENRCSIYSNNTTNRESGADIYANDCGTIPVIVDTFTVMNPTEYHAYPLDNFTFDILHAVNEQVYTDLYVSAYFGDNSNDGLTAQTPLKTIEYANSVILSSSTHRSTIYLTDGVYSPSTNCEFFPVEILSYVSLIGESEAGVILDAESVAGVMKCNNVTSATISNMTLTNGSASSGGGIYCHESNLNLENLTISNNSASSYGGGIYCNYSSDSSFDNVTISNNSAFYNGGGIYCHESNFNLEKLTISNNSASSGGGIYCSDSYLFFSTENKCSLYSNSICGGNGADIYADDCGTIPVIVDTFTVMNPSEYHAYPLSNFTFDILQAVFEPVVADLYVSALVGDNSNDGLTAQTPLKTIKCANMIILADSTNPCIIHLADGVYSPSINCEFFPVEIKNYVSLIGESEAGVILDAESITGVMECNGIASATISNMTLTNGSASDGGGIYCFESNPIFENITITNNSVSFGGGGIYCRENSNPKLANVTINNNTAFSSGGGIYCRENSNPKLANVTISNNIAYYGGGIYCYSDSYPNFSIENRCNIYSNNGEDENGADIYVYNCEPIAVIVDTFTMKYPTENLIFPLDNFTFDILHAIIEQSDADLYVSPNGDNNNDGLTAQTPLKTIEYATTVILANNTSPHTIHLANGVYSPSTNNEPFPVEMKNYVSLIGESEAGVILDAESKASVLECDGITSAAISNMTLTNGSASDGGGIYCFESNPNLSNITVVNNSADKGGGIYLEYSSPSLENVAISENTAETDGGGIYFYGGSSSLENVVISENAAESGGGIYCVASNPNLKSVVVNGNTAENGGGIYFDIANPNLENVTISGNSAVDNGSGIYCCNYSNSNLVNCIIWMNDLAEDIYGSGITAAYSDIQGGYCGEGNIDADPLFVDAENGDYHLQETSPCIDAGNPNSPFDPDGTIADMGAFCYHQDVGINDNQLAGYQLNNYPNPFSGETIINFSLSVDNMKNAKIQIYNVKGQKVDQLAITNYELENNQVTWNADNFASGIYFYKLVVDDKNVNTKKMILLK